jgi:hypothetical protein
MYRAHHHRTESSKVKIMKTIKYIPTKDKNSPKGYQVELSTAVSTEDFINFKRDYEYHIQEALQRMKNFGESQVFNLDLLPTLIDDLTELKTFMSDAKTIGQWNTIREQAKRFFTAPCISELDASGYISKLNLKKRINA